MLPTVKFEFVPDKLSGGLRVVLTTIVPTGRVGIAGSYTLFPVMDKYPKYLNIYDEDGLCWNTTYDDDREISKDTVLYGTTILNCGNWVYNTGIYADYNISQSDIILNKLLEWNKDVCDFLDKNDSKN